MGMFDTVSWADPLPFSKEMVAHGLNKNNWSFQTKDFDCSMDNYVVQGNQLFVIKYRDEKWIEGDPKAKNWSDRFGYMDRTGEYLDPVKVTTTVMVYDFLQESEWNRLPVPGHDYWVEFEVVFIDGKVDSVTLVKFTAEDNSERKQRDKEFQESLKREHARWRNRFFFGTRPYRFVARHIRRALNSTADFLYRLSNKL